MFMSLVCELVCSVLFKLSCHCSASKDYVYANQPRMCFIFFTDRTLVHCNTSSDICVYLALRLMLCWSIKEKLQEEIGSVYLLPSSLNRIWFISG